MNENVTTAERRVRYGRLRYKVNEGAFEGPVTEEMAYFAGLLITDGYIFKNGNSRGVGIALQAGDAPIIERLRAFLSSTHPINRYEVKSPKSDSVGTIARLTISSSRLADSLARFGIVPSKTRTAEAPASMLANRDWWRGTIDGDGMITFRGGRSASGRPVLCLVGTRQLVSQFLAFAQGLSPTGATVRPMQSIWWVRINGPAAIAVIRALYEGCSVALPRKLELAQKAIALDGVRRQNAGPRAWWHAADSCWRVTIRHGRYRKQHRLPTRERDDVIGAEAAARALVAALGTL